MAFRCWQVGVHIQEHHVAIVALSQEKMGWALRRWWWISLREGKTLVETLRGWRRELPYWHNVAMAFPANRTLQKRIPQPSAALRETEREQWMAHAVAQRLEMASEDLCFDYKLAEPAGEYCVTAVRRREVEALRQTVRSLNLQLSVVSPDASALQNFFPFLSAQEPCIIWQGEEHWLWATREAWGTTPRAQSTSVSSLLEHIPGQPASAALCSSESGQFDPWTLLSQQQPPLPACGTPFAVAIALSLGA